jgi:hypothetical protein
MSLLAPIEEPFLKKYKPYIIGVSVVCVIAVIVVVSLWIAGVFDSKSAPDVPQQPKSGPLQLVLNQDNLPGIEKEMSSAYSENSMIYTINWPVGSLQYKDVQGASVGVIFPEVTQQLLDGTFGQIPALIPKTAGEYGPYITKSNINVSVTDNRGAAGIVTGKTYPAGSIFAFKVDDLFNITCYFHLSQSGTADYLNTYGQDKVDEVNQSFIIKANPLNLRIMDGTASFSI